MPNTTASRFITPNDQSIAVHHRVWHLYFRNGQASVQSLFNETHFKTLVYLKPRTMFVIQPCEDLVHILFDHQRVDAFEALDREVNHVTSLEIVDCFDD